DIAFVPASGRHLLLCDGREELERLVIVLRNAVAFRIHARQLPARAHLAVFRRITVGFDSLTLFAALIGGKTEPEHRQRISLGGLHHALFVKRGRRPHRTQQKNGSGKEPARHVLRYPHSTALPSRHPDASPPSGGQTTRSAHGSGPRRIENLSS